MNVPHEPARDARLALRRARLKGTQALDDARRARDDARQRLVAARDTPERAWWDRQTRAWSDALHHPLHELARGIDAVVASTGLQPALARVRASGSPGAALPFAAAAIRGIDPRPRPGLAADVGDVSLHGFTQPACVARVDVTLTWRVTIDAGARLVTYGAPVFGLETMPPGAMQFELVATHVGSPWKAAARRVVDPRRRRADRHWRRLDVRIPAGVRGEFDVSLTLRTPPGAPRQALWGLWALPRLVHAHPTTRADAPADREGNHPMETDVEYRAWITNQRATIAEARSKAQAVERLAYRPTFSVLTPVHDIAAEWLHACVASVRRQTYPLWELCLVDDGSTSADTHAALDAYENVDPRIRILRLPTSGHICRASNAALDLATGDFIALLDHDDELSPDAFFEVASLLNAQPELDFIYSDEDKIDEDGTYTEPYYKPDWAPEHFLNFMYTNHLMVLRRTLVEAVGRFRTGFEGAQDYDLALRVTSVSTRVGHVPKVLYHWRKVAGSAAATPVAKTWALDAARRALEEHVERTGLRAEVLPGTAPGLFRVRRHIVGAPRVSIVIPTDDRTRDVAGRPIALVPHCVRSIHERSTYRNYELVIVDNGTWSASTEAALADIPHRRVSYRIDGRFNFPHKLNFSVRQAQGDYLVILNDDVEVITPGWLEALLEYAQDPEIGAVGARLLYPDRRLQHVGVAMGVCGMAAHLHHQAPADEAGYFGLALGPRNYSAVTGAVMMTRRSTYDRVGGFDERLAIDFNDIDYCLRLRAAGLRIVYTPYAELYHLESGTNGARTWDPAEVALMRERWADVFARDPYYNPNLGHDHPDPRKGMR